MGNIYENIEEYSPNKILFSLHNVILLYQKNYIRLNSTHYCITNIPNKQ